MPGIISLSYCEESPYFPGGEVGNSLGHVINASDPNSGWLPSYTSGVYVLPLNLSWPGVGFSSNVLANSIQALRLKYFLSFFDSLASDLPAIPTNYDGAYSFSSVSGAYHLVGGILLDVTSEQRYVYMCMRRASGSFVSIAPPYPIVEVVQVTSRYARFWRGNPVGPPLQQSTVPDQYCILSALVESPYPGTVNFKNLTIQVFHDWVAFSGEVMGDEEASVLIEIKRIPEMTVVRTLSGTTTNKRFYLDTHLPPGEYTYEAYAFQPPEEGSGQDPIEAM